MQRDTTKGLTVLLSLVVAILACIYAGVEKRKQREMKEAAEWFISRPPKVEVLRDQGDVWVRVNGQWVFVFGRMCGPTT